MKFRRLIFTFPGWNLGVVLLKGTRRAPGNALVHDIFGVVFTFVNFFSHDAYKNFLALVGLFGFEPEAYQESYYNAHVTVSAVGSNLTYTFPHYLWMDKSHTHEQLFSFSSLPQDMSEEEQTARRLNLQQRKEVLFLFSKIYICLYCHSET